MASPISLYVNETTQLTAKLNPASTGPMGSPSITWTTSDQTVAALVQWNAGVQYLATVSGTLSTVGKVTIQGLAAGTATITLTVGSLTDTISVTVSANQEVNIGSVSIVASYQ